MKNAMKTLAVLSAAAGTFFYASPLAAWQRTAKDTCKSERKECVQDVNDCKMGKNDSSSSKCTKMEEECNQDSTDCKKNEGKNDLASFEDALSPYSLSVFRKFSANQKEKAMVYADDNAMLPDDAVEKVVVEK